jgi:replicative DNA helicase
MVLRALMSDEDLKKIEEFNREQQQQETGEETWEQPISFDEPELLPFPTHIFPDWLGNQVLAVAESTQTPSDMASMAAISMLSIGAAKKFVINPHGDWYEPLNTFTLTLMPPANRKSSVFNEMSKPILLYEKDERERLELVVKNRNSERKALEKRKEHLQTAFAKKGERKYLEEIKDIDQQLINLPPLYLPVYIADDVTPEALVTLMQENNERIGVLSTEGGIFEIIKGRYSGNINLEVYLKGHSGDPLKVNRRGRTEQLNSPALTVGIFAQPDVIQDLPRAFVGRGLMARFLYSLPKDFKGFRKTRPAKIKPEIRSTYTHFLKRLMSIETEEPIVLTLNNEADFLFNSLEEEIELLLRPNEVLAEMGDWGGKLAGQLARIAALLHIAEHIERGTQIPTVIEAQTIVKVEKLKDYFIQHAKAAFGCMDLDEEMENAKYLLSKLLEFEKPKVSKQQLWQKIKNKKGFKKSYQLDDTLTILETRNYIRIIEEGSRGKKVIEINPMVHEEANTISSKKVRKSKPVVVLDTKQQEEPLQVNSRRDVRELGNSSIFASPASNLWDSKDESLLGELGEEFKESENEELNEPQSFEYEEGEI